MQNNFKESALPSFVSCIAFLLGVYTMQLVGAIREPPRVANFLEIFRLYLM
jgi:hypothetical protein